MDRPAFRIFRPITCRTTYASTFILRPVYCYREVIVRIFSCKLKLVERSLSFTFVLTVNAGRSKGDIFILINDVWVFESTFISGSLFMAIQNDDYENNTGEYAGWNNTGYIEEYAYLGHERLINSHLILYK